MGYKEFMKTAEYVYYEYYDCVICLEKTEKVFADAKEKYAMRYTKINLYFNSITGLFTV